MIKTKLSKDFKVLFSAGEQLSSHFLLGEVFSHLNPIFELRVASSLKSHSGASKNVPFLDWVTDPLYDLPNQRIQSYEDLIGREIYLPTVNAKSFRDLFESVKKWSPDLIVTDQEPVLLCVAKALEIPSWDISSLNFMMSPLWWDNQDGYSFRLYNFRRNLRFYAEPTRRFIYSPLFRARLDIKPLSWIAPWTSSKLSQEDLVKGAVLLCNRPAEIYKTSKITVAEDLQNLPRSEMYFCSGETQLLSELLSHPEIEKIHLAPNLEDPETIINAVFIEQARIGKNLGQIEFMKSFGIHTLYETLNRSYSPARLSREPGLEMTLDQRIIHEFNLQ